MVTDQTMRMMFRLEDMERLVAGALVAQHTRTSR